MKIKTHDDLEFPIGYDPSGFYKTPEVFIQIPKYIEMVLNINTDQYLISNWGRLYNKATGRYLPQLLIKPSNKNYVVLAVKGIHGEESFISMHTLMAAVYHPPVPVINLSSEYVVDHIDAVKWHNEPYNLRWATQKENARYANENNLVGRPFGQDNSQSVLSDEEYHEICRLTQEGYMPNEINKIMNIGRDITNIAQKIRSGTSETLISSQYDFSNIKSHNYRKFSDEDVRMICSLICSNLSDDEILLKLGYDIMNESREFRYLLRKRIRNIRNKTSFQEISKDYPF